MEKNINAKVISEIRQAILRYKMADKGDHIVFGLSGGPDSVCLFFAFYLMREELGITMSAVHINHKFRPGAAEEDQSYVENLCDRLGIRCRSEVCDCGEIAERLGITSEEAGRKVRYEAFDAEAAYMQEQLGIAKSQVKIAIAHNMEDQAETILFRLMRGTGTDGLSGIERKRTSENGYTIIRPILGISRKDIEEFCKEFELAPHIDLTNLEPIYTRNKIRLGLIPYIQENFNENITEALNRLAVIAGEDREYMRQQAEKCYEEARKNAAASELGIDRLAGLKSVDKSSSEKEEEIALNMEILRNTPNAIRHRVMMKSLAELGLTQDISAVHMDAADSLIERGVTGKTAEFPYGYKAVTRYGDIVFKKPQASASGDIKKNADKRKISELHKNIEASPILTAKIVTAEEWREYERQKNDSGAPKNFAAFDYNALCEAKGGFAAAEEAEEKLGCADVGLKIVLRGKEAGDFIALTVGRKKVQDLLVDSKVPRDLRSSVLFAAAGNEILWMIGADSGISCAATAKSRFTANYKISQASKKVLILEIGE